MRSNTGRHHISRRRLAVFPFGSTFAALQLRLVAVPRGARRRYLTGALSSTTDYSAISLILTWQNPARAH
jgi:hypothetical protein